MQSNNGISEITLNRRSSVPQASPDPNEAAYIRPSVINPPENCEPKMRTPMKPTHRVTSCMGDSGGPLVMKGKKRSTVDDRLE